MVVVDGVLFTYTPHLVVGDVRAAGDDAALGLRHGVRGSLADFLGLQVGHQVLFPGGDARHDLHLLAAVDPLLGLQVLARSAHGRPLRVDGAPTVAGVVVGAADHGDAVAPLVALPDPEREALGAAWLADARMEHASIAAFMALSRQLRTLGAPDRLIRWAERAAEQEREHARTCFLFASAYLGVPLGPGPLPEVPEELGPGDASILTRLAVESWVDGCLGEGSAARAARRAARDARDPTIRAALRRIARDEAEHAELAWAIVAWCLERTGPELVKVLRAASPPVEPGVSEPEALAAHLIPHGRLPAAAWRDIADRTAASAARRLERVLRSA
jgi:hypothetical protein